MPPIRGSTLWENSLKKDEKIIIDKDMLKYLMTAGTTNTDIYKIFNVNRNMVARWIKENELANELEEPNDDRFLLMRTKYF